MNIIKATHRRGAPPAKGGHPPLIPPGYTVVGGGARGNSHFFTRKIRSAGLETVNHCV